MLRKLLPARLRTQARSVSVIASQLVYSEFGEPVDVVRRAETKLSDVQPDDVLVKVLAAPINPADMNTIQGRYPVKPPLPAIGGTLIKSI